MSQSHSIPAKPGSVQHTRVSVAVHDHRGLPVTTTAEVALTLDGERHVLARETDSNVYRASLPQGDYLLETTAGRQVSPLRDITVEGRQKHTDVYIGNKSWPYYRLGEHAVPFEPPNDLIAVAFPRRKPDAKTAESIRTQLLKKLPVDLVDMGDQPGCDEQNMPADGAVWVFRVTEKQTAKLWQKLRDAIDAATAGAGRVGVPTCLAPGQCAVMDGRFVVSFKREVTPGEIQKHVDAASGTILRRFRQAPNAVLVEFPPDSFDKHLAAVEAWHAAGLLVYGEPDLMAELTDDVFPEDPPNDPTYTNQANLTLQRVDIAWRILNSRNPDLTLGDPNITVASLDRGLDTDHPDIGGNLTDGNTQVSRCFDFSGMRECSVAGYEPDTDHGMGVYGIIAAEGNNNEDIIGIAPNTHQVVMERPSLTDASYPDVLLWAAGFTTDNTDADWPAEPLANGADIISCSHGSNNLALSGIMDDTYRELANNGRGGLGTIVVYSAGNDNTLITGFRTWAAHPNTIAVANSAQPDGMGIERKVGSSNFGPEIDVCAQGAGAPSLDASGGEQNFGGTSAAAPTVAGIAALILSMDPGLSWNQVRDRLRNTAVQIDAANTDPVGQYVGGFSQWYGFGRVDAAAAVCGATPAVTLDTLSVNFNDVPEGETTSRAIDFSVESCEPVTLQIVAGPGAQFSTPLGVSDFLDFHFDSAPRPAKIWLSYTGTTDGDTANSSVTVRWMETGEEWVIPISANTIARPTVVVELALDQSGSMDFSSGITELPRRIDVLKASIPPLLEVIHADNGIGIVSFDHDAHPVMPITPAGVPVFGAGRSAAKLAVQNHAPNPAGGTAIGDGVDLGQAQLAPETGYDEKAMIVFTDGHETAAQYISDVDHLIDDRVYAIGLGNADTIQPSALEALTNGTGGYLLLTGDLAGDDYFLLAKYYLQILAGVTNEEIVLDPQGFLAPNQRVTIPFDLAETDITSDIILLTPAPGVIRFTLETPNGDFITPANVTTIPGADHVSGQQVSYYRISLPVPLGDGAAAGKWQAHLEIDGGQYKRYIADLRREAEKNQDTAEHIERIAAHGIRYSLNVHSYSNLRLTASVSQNSFEPGATMTLQAGLTEYGIPVENRAHIQAVVTSPNRQVSTIDLAEGAAGIFTASLEAQSSGVYRFHLLARGRTLRERAFTRELIVTGAVWRGGNNPPPDSSSHPEGNVRDGLCELLDCLFSHAIDEKRMAEQLAQWGIDLQQLKRCLSRLCNPNVQRPTPRGRANLAPLRSPELVARLRRLIDDLEGA